MGIAEVDIQGLESLPTGIDMTASTGADCGFGPVVEVDGTPHETAVTGTLDDVRLGRPLTWWVCDGPARLSAAGHRVTVEPTNRFTPVELAWRPATLPADAPVLLGSDRSLDVGSGGALSPRRVGAGEAAVLRVAENVNDGWRARLVGRALEPVTLDGWQQGYPHPAGQGGRVTLTYVPDATAPRGAPDRWGAGALLVLAAAAGQVWSAAAAPNRRRHRPERCSSPTTPSGRGRPGPPRDWRSSSSAAAWRSWGTSRRAAPVRRMALASGGLLIAGLGSVAARPMARALADPATWPMPRPPRGSAYCSAPRSCRGGRRRTAPARRGHPPRRGTGPRTPWSGTG